MMIGDCCPSKRWATLAKLKFLDISPLPVSLIIKVAKFEDRYEHDHRYPEQLDFVYKQPEKAIHDDLRHVPDRPIM